MATIMNISENSAKDSERGLVTNDMFNVYGITLSVTSSVVCTLGIITNLVNILVFIKQGLNDTVTLTLLALALSDLGAVITMFGVGLCFSPLVAQTDTDIDTSAVSFMFGWAHNTMARISSGYTVFISFERCLCIALPLKVKSIITMRRTVVILVSITFIMTASVVPVFYTSRMAWTFSPDTNRTIFTLSFTDDRLLVDAISMGVNTVFLIPMTLILMISFTVVLVVQLHRKAKWRGAVTRTDSSKAKTSSNEGGSLSPRDRKVVKMVVLISCIAIVCFIPNFVNTLVAILLPEVFDAGKREENLFFMTGTLCLLLQAMNSSVNIFIYLSMSTNFRSTLWGLVSGCRTRKMPGEFSGL